MTGPKNDYIDKIIDIPKDETKFQKVDWDTAAKLKADINKQIKYQTILIHGM